MLEAKDKGNNQKLNNQENIMMGKSNRKLQKYIYTKGSFYYRHLNLSKFCIFLKIFIFSNQHLNLIVLDEIPLSVSCCLFCNNRQMKIHLCPQIWYSYQILFTLSFFHSQLKFHFRLFFSTSKKTPREKRWQQCCRQCYCC